MTKKEQLKVAFKGVLDCMMGELDDIEIDTRVVADSKATRIQKVLNSSVNELIKEVSIKTLLK